MARNLFTNARVVTPSEVFLGTVEVYADRIVRVDLGATSLPRAEDFGGDYLLPGLVDLDAGWLSLPHLPEEDLIATDLAAASAGCTTVFTALAVDASGALASAPGLARIADRLADWRQRGTLRCDHFFRLIVSESCSTELTGEFLLRLGTSLARLVTLPGSRFEAPDDAFVPLSNRWREAGAALGLHTPTHGGPIVTTAETRPDYCEGLPVGTTVTGTAVRLVSAHEAGAAKAAGDRWTPNDTVCLTSGGAPVDLLRSVFRQHDRLGWPLPAATACATAIPARLAGLPDRGRVEVGLRADFIRVRREGPLAIPIATWRAGQRFS